MKRSRPLGTAVLGPDPAAVRLTAAAGPAPATLAPDDDALLAGMALAVRRRGLETPAVLWLESLRPLSFVGAQAMHALTPFVQLLVPASQFGRLAEIFEERGHLERLLRLIETAAEAPDGPPPTEARP